jgi:hypothetical protein
VTIVSENTIESGTDEFPEVSGTDYPGPGGAHVQHTIVPSETGGYLAPGGNVRRSIRDRIKAARPYVSEQVEVPEWEATVEVRSMSLGERQQMFVDLSDPETGDLDKSLLEAGYIRACTFDPETGERVFQDDDLDLIQSLAAGTADRVGQVAMKLSGNADKDTKDGQEAEAKK